MRKFFAAVLLGACAAAGPVLPTGEKPAWVSTPNGDLRFPPDRFIAQVGSAAVGTRSAPELLAAVDGAARAAVTASLTRSIAAEAGAQRAPELLQQLDLATAIRIEGRWRQGETAYAWAVFDRQGALAAQQARVADHEKLAKDLIAQGAAGEREKPADALRAYAKARSEAAATSDGVLLVRALGGKLEEPGTAAAAEQKAAALLGELTLNVVDGDQQRAAEGAPLAQPIVFTAWLKGKRAVGLPMAVTIANGGRAPSATVGPDGKAEVRVESIGKFVKPEQQIQIAVDWAALLGVAPEKVPAWIGAGLKAGITAVALRKGAGTTRVLVLIAEKVEGEDEVASPPVAGRLARALTAAGFAEVQNGQALLAKFGPGRIAAMKDEELRAAAKRFDVVVVGSAASRSVTGSGAAVARGNIRALDVATGAVLWQAPTGEVKGKRAGEPTVAGRSALDALGEALGPNLGVALKKAAAQ